MNARAVALGWVGLAALLVVAALPRLSLPGLYYDEAFMASQAKDFVEPQLRAQHPPGVRSVWLAGRPFPLMNVAYLGALKSQLTIPALALFGSRVEVLRATTLAASLLALLFTMLWAERVFGAKVALAGGLLVAADPTVQFLSLYEWGPFTTGFLCRAAGLWLVTSGWTARGPWRLAAGGLVFGLGVFSRVDFAVFLAAAGVALVAVRPGVLAEAVGPGRARVALAVAALALGMAPTLAVLDVLADTVGVMPDRGGLAQKLTVAAAMLDGSYAWRLMAVGGRFERLAEVASPPWGLFGLAVAAAFAGLAVYALRRAREGRRDRPREFLLLATALLGAGMLALPGAVRVHHLMNVVPLPHLIVASALVALAGAGRAPRRARGRRAAGAAAALALAAVVASDVAVAWRTAAAIHATGGRGWWSDALGRFAGALDDAPGTTVVSLDWGFHEPLLFLTRRARLEEPIWEARRRLAGGAAWTVDGDTRTVYLAHEADWDRFGMGPPFLAAVARLPEADVEVTPWRDRAGDVAFVAVRFLRPHRLRFADGVELVWRKPRGAARPAGLPEREVRASPPASP